MSTTGMLSLPPPPSIRLFRGAVRLADSFAPTALASVILQSDSVRSSAPPGHRPVRLRRQFDGLQYGGDMPVPGGDYEVIDEKLKTKCNYFVVIQGVSNNRNKFTSLFSVCLFPLLFSHNGG
jgi:hypothetical protein